MDKIAETDTKCITKIDGTDTKCITNEKNRNKNRNIYGKPGTVNAKLPDKVKIHLTKEEAANYKNIKNEINTLADELQRLDTERQRSTPILKQSEAGITTGGKVIYDRMAELTAMYIDAERECLEKIYELQLLETHIKAELDKIPNLKLKTVLFKRYIHSKSYRSIILEMGLNQSEGTLRTVVANFWKSLQASEAPESPGMQVVSSDFFDRLP